MNEQKLLATALSGAANAAFITDASGTIVWVNRAFTQLYGHSAEAAIGQSPRLLQSGKHGSRYYQALWSAIRGGRPWSGQTVDRAADGQLVTIRQTITPLRQDGKITHYLSIHSDISAEAETSAIAQIKHGTDELTGLQSHAAFEAHCREVLERARVLQHGSTVMLIAVEHSCGRFLHLEPHAASFVSGVVGERIRRALGREAVVGVLQGFDFAAMIPDPEPVIDSLRGSLAKVMREPLPLLGDTLTLICETALARFPDDGENLDQLLNTADRRLMEYQPAAPVHTRSGSKRGSSDMAVERE
ncbi:MAG: PAS domain S-box protein [Nevskia sp.]|nr:PAS domain S-box protein [Nevskia sp.]